MSLPEFEAFDRRQKAPVTRSEHSVAVNVVALLMRDGVIPRDARRLALACRTLGITPREVERACEDLRNGLQLQPGENVVSLRARSSKPEIVPFPTKDKPRLNRRSAERDGPDGRERRCPRCKTWKPATVEHFYLRRPTTGGLSAMCLPCMKDYQHERYLTVRKIEALNALGVQFVLRDVDDVDGLRCPECDLPVETGQTVVLDPAHVHHALCVD